MCISESCMQHICMGYAPHMKTLRHWMCHDSITSDVLVCTIAITHSYCALMYAEHINESWHLISFNHCNTHCSTLQHTLQHTATHTAAHTAAHTAVCGTYQRVMASNLIQSLQHTLQHTATHTATHCNTHCCMRHISTSHGI